VLADPDNKALLIRFLNMFLCEDMCIKDITDYLDREDNGPGEGYKDFRCDLKCCTEDGKIFIVEMQKVWHSHFFERCVFYGSRAYGRELVRGQRYGELAPVVVFAILGEQYPHEVPSLWKENQDLVANYVYTEKRTGEIAPESISVIFVELGRFTKEDDTQLSGEYESLFYLLKHVHEYDQIPERLMVGMNKDLVRASEIAAFDEVKRNQYESDMMNEMDYAQIREDAEVKGYARGKEEGMNEGKEEVARNFLARGVDINIISECTGLSVEQIKAL